MFGRVVVLVKSLSSQWGGLPDYSCPCSFMLLTLVSNGLRARTLHTCLHVCVTGLARLNEKTWLREATSTDLAELMGTASIKHFGARSVCVLESEQ